MQFCKLYVINEHRKKWKWLGKVFAVFGVFVGLMRIGTFTQINGITSVANSFFDPEKSHTILLFGNEYTITQIIVGIIITVLAALIILVGIQSIVKVSEIFIPLMIVVYVCCCLIIIFTHLDAISSAVAEILQSAFGLKAMSGGVLGAIMVSMQKGIAIASIHWIQSLFIK